MKKKTVAPLDRADDGLPIIGASSPLTHASERLIHTSIDTCPAPLTPGPPPRRGRNFKVTDSIRNDDTNHCLTLGCSPSSIQSDERIVNITTDVCNAPLSVTPDTRRGIVRKRPHSFNVEANDNLAIGPLSLDLPVVCTDSPLPQTPLQRGLNCNMGHLLMHNRSTDMGASSIYLQSSEELLNVPVGGSSVSPLPHAALPMGVNCNNANLFMDNGNTVMGTSPFSLQSPEGLVNVPVRVSSDVVSLNFGRAPLTVSPMQRGGVCPDVDLISIPVDYGRVQHMPSKKKKGKTKHTIVRMTSFEGETSAYASTECDNYVGPNGNVPPTTSCLLPPAASCEFCKAKRFFKESPGFCCSSGEVKTASNPSPAALSDLFRGTNQLSKDFKTYVRTYNNTFAFTSFGVRYDKDLCKRDNGIYTFKAQGQVYHFVDSLVPSNNPPKNLQLYFYDTDHEMENRMQLSDSLDSALIDLLLSILQANPYVQFFRSLMNVRDLNVCRILLRSTTSLDQRVYNSPTTSQVAAIWVEGDSLDGTSDRDIIVYSHSGNATAVQYYYGCYDPLQYPILFPLGESGWHEGIKKVNAKKRGAGQLPLSRGSTLSDSSILPPASSVTSVDELISNEERVLSTRNTIKGTVSCREYYCYKLQIRAMDNSILLRSGRLLQQYVVDMYIKLESSRLDYFRLNQKKIRSEVYSGIVDSIAGGERRGSKVGNPVILPASFIGGPRDMRRRYLDAMALVQRFGKPDLFITMTCNPNWSEIKKELIPGEEAQNRPDLLARVFRAKFEELKNEILKKGIFGAVAGHVYVIEFQKRGLPHMHMLLILERSCKIRAPEHYDRFVSAEIPDEGKNPHLFHMVSKHMIHGPCGVLNLNNVCMKKNGMCSKHFPKDFISRTTQREDSYPLYRRVDNGRKVTVRKHTLDNRWVIPYNPYLLAKYDCHINVEVCSTIKAVKYLYKYIYKGHDRVSFHVSSVMQTDNNDEIKNFRDGRWVSPPEAMWRIYAFVMNEVHPVITTLQLHLEDKQTVCYDDSADLQGVIDYSLCRKTTLTEYFAKNRDDPNARNILYRDFPEHYIWKDKAWHARKKGFAIGRIVSVNPIEGERYYLRLLLNNIRGATGYDELRAVNGAQCVSFREAATLLGLVELDDCYRISLMESTTYQMPQSLRRLFTTILVYCNPVNGRQLWEEFTVPLSEDFMRRPGVTYNMAVNMALKDISYQLESMGKNINDYKLFDEDLVDMEERGHREISDELSLPVSPADVSNVSVLNTTQREAYDAIFKCVLDGKQGAFFVDGPGGTGKSFLYSVLLANVRSRGLIAIATASSGVAASVLPGGRTAHSRFKIPLDNDNFLCCSVKKQSGLSKLIQSAKLIIWDEAPMVRRQAIEAFERMLRDICECQAPFGGKFVVFGGDFRQILPVIQRASIEQTIEASLVKSALWVHLQKFRLSENVRARLDPEFSQLLLKIGEGRLTPIFDDEIQLPPSIVLPYGQDSLEALMELTFPELTTYQSRIGSMINRAILSTTNDFVDEINETIINRFTGDLHEYKSFDEPLELSNQGLQEDFFNSLTPSGFPPHILKLKKSCPVILLRNIDPSQGLCNGARLICTSFGRNTLGATVATGNYSGKHVLLPRIPFTPTSGDEAAFPFRRRQFPVRLCFSMTINKAQGQTLDFVGIYLPQPVFSHGQLYVALSRARMLTSVAVLIVPADGKRVISDTTRNVVYRSVLELAAVQ